MKGVELLGREPAGKGLGSGVGPVLDAWTRTNHQSSSVSLDIFRASPPPPQLHRTLQVRSHSASVPHLAP